MCTYTSTFENKIKLIAPAIPGPIWAEDTNDWCIRFRDSCMIRAGLFVDFKEVFCSYLFPTPSLGEL